MNKLNNVSIYLAGPIDRVNDDGVVWRRNLKNLCRKRNINFQFLDPTDKIEKQKSKSVYLKRNRKWTELTNHVKQYRRVDTRMIDKSDAIIAMVDPEVHMMGTIHEMIFSTLQRKPLYVIAKGGRSRMSDWLFSLVDWPFMFDDIEDCVNHLHKLNQGMIDFSSRWVLFPSRKD